MTITNERGFTFIELILVIVMIGVLAAAAVQKLMSVSEDVQIASEDTTMQNLQNNLTTNMGSDLLRQKGTQGATFSPDPFANLSRTPEGYNRLRTYKPTGQPEDDNLWVFIAGPSSSGGPNITPDQAGTTVTTFLPTGFIYHQRPDHTIVKWPYDAVNGIIGRKIIERASDTKIQADLQRKQRGEVTETDKYQLQSGGVPGK